MSIKISTLLSKVDSLSNIQKALILTDFHKYMQYKGFSENHQINNLKTIIDFARFLGPEEFCSISKKEQILSFLNTNQRRTARSSQRWITTCAIIRIKHLFRWIYNQRGKADAISQSEWTTAFCQNKRIKNQEVYVILAYIKLKEQLSKHMSLALYLLICSYYSHFT
jgi:hypothetical protein